MKNLFLIRGIPGSGKSTIADFLRVDFNICADNYHINLDGVYDYKQENSKDAHEWCQKNTENAMSMGVSTSVHNTFTQEWEMQPYFELAKKYGYTVHTIIVENRRGSESIHNVPAEVIQKMRDRFEVKL